MNTLQTNIIAFAQYLKIELNVSRHTLTAYTKDLEQMEDFITHNQLDFDKKSLRKLVKDMVIQNLSPASINRKISAIKRFSRWMYTEGLIPDNPAQALTFQKKPANLPRYLPQEKIRQAIKTASDRDQLIIELLYATGMRLNELASLRPADISMQDSTIIINGKGAKQRLMPVNQNLLDRLQHYARNLEEDKQIFRQYDIQRVIKENLNSTPHQLRHSFATHMLNNGADIRVLQAMLGHTSIASTQVYTHVATNTIRETFKKTHPLGIK